MKASEARELMNNKPVLDNLERLYDWIKTRAKDGFNYTWLIEAKLSDQQLKELLANGFEVEINATDYKITW